MVFNMVSVVTGDLIFYVTFRKGISFIILLGSFVSGKTLLVLGALNVGFAV